MIPRALLATSRRLAAQSAALNSLSAAPVALRQFTQSAASWQAEGKEEKPAADANGAQQAAAAAADPLKQCQEELAKAKAQVQEERSARLRVLAEMENVGTIAKRDVAQAKDYALQGFAKNLLNVVDNLQRAVASVPAEAREKRPGNESMATLYEGVAATEREFMKILGQQGITQFGKVGEPFDYNKHEALMQVPATSGAPANTISSVLVGGWALKDRVLRVAKVAIAVDQPASS